MRRTVWNRCGWWLAGLALGAAAIGWGAGQRLPARAEEPTRPETRPADQNATADEWALGRELFHRSWLPDDPRSSEGDGLGPMFNESSCVACHNQGGPGGGGPASKNVELLTAFVSQPMFINGPGNFMPGTGPSPVPTGGQQVGPISPPVSSAAQRKAIAESLARIHPGFRKSSSVVIHRFGTSSNHTQWRNNLLNLSPPAKGLSHKFKFSRSKKSWEIDWAF